MDKKKDLVKVVNHVDDSMYVIMRAIDSEDLKRIVKEYCDVYYDAFGEGEIYELAAYAEFKLPDIEKLFELIDEETWGGLKDIDG